MTYGNTNVSNTGVTKTFIFAYMTAEERRRIRLELARRLLHRRDVVLRLSRDEVAQDAGMSSVTLANYEKAKRDPKLIDVVGLAKVLKCELIDLLPPEVLGRPESGGEKTADRTGEASSAPSTADPRRTTSFRLSTYREISTEEAELVRMKLELLEQEDALIEQQRKNLEARKKTVEEFEATIKRGRSESGTT